MHGYFDFLCRKVGIGGPEGRPYRRLAQLLYKKGFFSELPGDLNREKNARTFRDGYSDAPDGCGRVLEVLVGMCQEMAYLADGMAPSAYSVAEEWFMRMIENLGLSSLTDEQWEEDAHGCIDIAEHQLRIWLERNYDYDGTGGLFPLQDPHDDQTKVELWYQMNAYLMEQIDAF